MATTSPGSRFATAWLHSIKHSWKRSGSSRENTSPKVSWDGMPLGRSKKVRNHSSLLLPNISTWTHESAPQITAQMATVMTSSNWCRLHRSILGSSKSPKYSIIDAPLPLSITPYDPPSHSLSHPKPSLSSITRLPCSRTLPPVQSRLEVLARTNPSLPRKRDSIRPCYPTVGIDRDTLGFPFSRE